jgi:hypothetical protein
MLDVTLEAIKIVQSKPQTFQFAETALKSLLGLMQHAHGAPQSLAAALHLLPSVHKQPQAHSPLPSANIMAKCRSTVSPKTTYI